MNHESSSSPMKKKGHKKAGSATLALMELGGEADDSIETWDAEEARLLSLFFSGGDGNNHYNSNVNADGSPASQVNLFQTGRGPSVAQPPFRNPGVPQSQTHVSPVPERTESSSSSSSSLSAFGYNNMSPNNVMLNSSHHPTWESCPGESPSNSVSNSVSNSGSNSNSNGWHSHSPTEQQAQIMMLPPPPRLHANLPSQENNDHFNHYNHDQHQAMNMNWLNNTNQNPNPNQNPSPKNNPFLQHQPMYYPNPGMPLMMTQQNPPTPSQISTPPQSSPSPLPHPSPIITSHNSPNDNDEKRSRRLARNRESARQSRRRKKEVLLTLGDKVNKFHTGIEIERRASLNAMEEGLRKYREAAVESLNESSTAQDEATSAALRKVVYDCGPDCDVRIAAAGFQYDQMRNMLLPRHFRFLLWLSLREEEFFTNAKDERAKMAGRVSSKQIGEEITATFRNNSTTPPPTSKNPKNTITCPAHTSSTYWPLFCYDLMLSVDQEDRFLQARKRIKLSSKHYSQTERNNMASSIAMTSNLKRGVLHHSRTTANRVQDVLFKILTPDQAKKFVKWSLRNKERCRRRLPTITTTTTTHENYFEQDVRNAGHGMTNSQSLGSLCAELDDAMNIENQLLQQQPRRASEA